MAYFAPYIDENGIHMPTYEDRLEDLCEAYRSIFGLEAELSASVPDYQLLSVFAKALDEAAALVLQADNSRNPMYAGGEALDLLLPQYGISREEGETDAQVRSRIRSSLAGRGFGSYDALRAAVQSVKNVRDVKVWANETDETDENGIPAHSISVVIRGGRLQDVGQAIWNKKPPGIGTYGNMTVDAVDAEGNLHPVSFERYVDKMVFLYVFIRVLDGGDQETIRNVVGPAMADYVDDLGLATPLNVPQLYGAAYSADTSIADTFIVTDIQAAVLGESGVSRVTVPCAWNEKITVLSNGGVIFYFV